MKTRKSGQTTAETSYLVAQLAAHGFGVRETARALEVVPSLVMYHRNALGIETPKPSDNDLFASLPASLQDECIAYRGH